MLAENRQREFGFFRFSHLTAPAMIKFEHHEARYYQVALEGLQKGVHVASWLSSLEDIADCKTFKVVLALLN